MVRSSWMAVASGLFLSWVLGPAAHARPQQPAANQQQPSNTQGAQGDQDQSGPPTLRHSDDPQPTQPNKSANPATAPSEPGAPAPKAPGEAAAAPTAAPPAENAPALTEQSKIELLRSIDGEFVKILTPLPGGKNGYHFKAGAPLDQDSLHKALTFGGVALNVGDSGQITKARIPRAADPTGHQRRPQRKDVLAGPHPGDGRRTDLDAARRPRRRMFRRFSKRWARRYFWISTGPCRT